MKDVISELDIPKSDYTLPKEYFWYDTKYVEVPNVINMELKNAKKELKSFTVNYSGKGDYIRSISPSPGTIIPMNSEIKILLGNWQNVVKSLTF